MKDVIRRRGENISSYEVEQVLLSHPDVAAAAAFPVRSELAEDEVMAAIVLHEGCMLTPPALAEYCDGRMPAFAVPRFIEFLAALPMTENGKVQKFRLRERGVNTTTWDRDTGGR
jgi:crotonobetaine/carnitine-CoA ligase